MRVGTASPGNTFFVRYLQFAALIVAVACVPGTALAQVESAASHSARAMQTRADYAALTGRWQLVKSIVDGKPVPDSEMKDTVLITDHDEFRFPADARVGTAPLGKFKIDPGKRPKTVDSTALSGPDKGKVTKGIYEIIDANNKRACWGKPGGPRPTAFTSAPGSGRTLQYWRLISKDLGK